VFFAVFILGQFWPKVEVRVGPIPEIFLPDISPPTVCALLSTHASAKLQPLVIDVVEYKDSNGVYQSHDIIERIPLAGFAFNSTVNIVRRVVENSETRCIIEHQVSAIGIAKFLFSGVQTFHVEERVIDGKKGSTVEDRFNIRSTYLLGNLFVAPTAEAAHLKLLQNLKQTLTAQKPSSH